MNLFTFVYELVPVLAVVQFPWRFLGPAGLFLSAFGGLAPEAALARLTKLWAPSLAALGILACLLLAQDQLVVNPLNSIEYVNTFGVRERLPTEQLNSLQGRQTMVDRRLVWALSKTDEYLPRGVPARVLEVAAPAQFMLYAPKAHVEKLQTDGSAFSFRATTGPEGASVNVPWFYFPGWQIRVDDEQIEASADQYGFLTFRLPAGIHKVRVWFGTTLPRSAGWIIALLSLCLCLALGWMAKPRKSSSPPVEQSNFPPKLAEAP
jgi:hypothetical protein